jgi:hypothetical protein
LFGFKGIRHADAFTFHGDAELAGSQQKVYKVYG